MQALLTLKGGGISFANDPKALAFLLFRIIGMSRNTGGVIFIGELVVAARDIGYRGSARALSRMLIAQGFLAEREKGRSFFFREEHHAAARQFFLEHEALLSGSGLSDAERMSLFERFAPGSETEKTVLRIMKLLSALSAEFRSLSYLEYAVQAGIAEKEAEHFIALDRATWLAERMDAAYGMAASAQSYTTFAGKMKFARAEVEAAGFEAVLNRVHDEMDGRATALHVLARQEELVLLLQAFRYYFDGLVQVFASKEGGGE